MILIDGAVTAAVMDQFWRTNPSGNVLEIPYTLSGVLKEVE